MLAVDSSLSMSDAVDVIVNASGMVEEGWWTTAVAMGRLTILKNLFPSTSFIFHSSSANLNDNSAHLDSKSMSSFTGNEMLNPCSTPRKNILPQSGHPLHLITMIHHHHHHHSPSLDDAESLATHARAKTKAPTAARCDQTVPGLSPPAPTKVPPRPFRCGWMAK